jgi:hypothetical protein
VDFLSHVGLPHQNIMVDPSEGGDSSQQKPPSFRDLEIRRVLAAGKAAKTPLDLRR